MFRRVAPILALLPMLCHSILGCCCWHDALLHRVTQALVKFADPSVQLNCGCCSDHCARTCHHTADGPEQSPARGGHCPYSPGGDDRCEFSISSASILPQTVQLELGWLNAVPLALEVALQPSRATFVSLPPRDGTELLPSGQKRSLVQVWLL